MRENDTPQERTERHEFVEAIIDTPPMRVARDYIGRQTGAALSDERWHNVLMDHWFRRFTSGGDPELSGFEHIVVGEQEGGKVQGYHFWYKYFLDDGFARAHAGDADFTGLIDDQIAYAGSHLEHDQALYPESVTFAFRWQAPDYEAKAIRPLFKKKGGFFVGCSVEGLMALGTVRAHVGADAPKHAIIEGARYQMALYLSGNQRHIRTFYPIFKGPVDPVNPDDGVLPNVTPTPDTPPPPAPGAVGDMRILAALINPRGHDPGHETVTLMNVGPEPIPLHGWALVDKNDNRDALANVTLNPGTPHVVALSGNDVQLSNKGGTIFLVNPAGAVVHRVTYSRTQARAENRTVVF